MGSRGLSLLCPRARSPRSAREGLRLAAGPAACRLLPVLSQELLQGLDNGPEGVGGLWDRGGRAVEGVAVIPALLPQVGRDR